LPLQIFYHICHQLFNAYSQVVIISATDWNQIVKITLLRLEKYEQNPSTIIGAYNLWQNYMLDEFVSNGQVKICLDSEFYQHIYLCVFRKIGSNTYVKHKTII
jgi:hypothetical protein